jgi:hypothetical protein
MENNQDYAFNTLNILDESYADSHKNGCAVFNGGIYVDKNIHTNFLFSENAEVDNLKIFDTLCVQKCIKIEGDILPLDTCNLSYLGTPNHKWDHIYSINTNTQNLISIHSDIKNLKINNFNLSFTPITLINTNINNIIDLDSVVIYINLLNTTNKGITIIIEKNKNNYNYHKIIFSQYNKLNIHWHIHGNQHFSSNSNNQMYELYNMYDKWHILNNDFTHFYNKQMDYNFLDLSLNNLNNELYDINNNISSIHKLINYYDTSLNKLYNTINSINSFNNTNTPYSYVEYLSNKIISYDISYNIYYNNIIQTNNEINNINSYINLIKSDYKHLLNKVDTYILNNNKKINNINDNIINIDNKLHIILKYLNLE